MSDPTIINLPYNSAGVLTNLNGFGSVSGQRSPRQLQLVMRFTFQEGSGTRDQGRPLLTEGRPFVFRGGGK